jgi:hypothetical protein
MDQLPITLAIIKNIAAMQHAFVNSWLIPIYILKILENIVSIDYPYIINDYFRQLLQEKF